MDNVGYLALSRAAMVERSTDMVAHNIANANSDGYRAKRATFEELIVSTKDNTQLEKLSYALDTGTRVDTTGGALIYTGRQFDVAIQGDGWFGFERTDGTIAFGRQGGFERNIDGDLVTPEGHAVLDVGGGRINIPAEILEVAIGTDGTISTLDGPIARIGVFEAPAANGWKSLDGAMLTPHEGAPALIPAPAQQVTQGFTEGSNVNPILEMTQMISLQRSYERSMNLADAANNLRRDTIQRIGRPS